jgi:hypothetical protein
MKKSPRCSVYRNAYADFITNMPHFPKTFSETGYIYLTSKKVLKNNSLQRNIINSYPLKRLGRISGEMVGRLFAFKINITSFKWIDIDKNHLTDHVWPSSWCM